MDFCDKNILQQILSLSSDEKDKFDFGIIGIDEKKIIIDYNHTEELLSGYKKEFVIGKNLFLDIAPCMNNYLVALKFEERDQFDEIIPYILSFKVKPVSVDLRLIKDKDRKIGYVLVKRR
ncbi:MAG TPA: PAS domain-containing protein [Spirochaetota bacterium]|nr:PAS domain-containing protein [Spirochaetota bacterium]